jgi:hypothetical protein
MAFFMVSSSVATEPSSATACLALRLIGGAHGMTGGGDDGGVRLARDVTQREPIIHFTDVDVSRYILVIDISVLAKSNMGRREY